jgi:hypothetical protein
MDTKWDTKTVEWQRIEFKKAGNSEEIYWANIFSTHPYVTFTDKFWVKIEGTGYEFSTPELQWKTEELIKSAIDFIEEHWRIIIE